MYHGNESQGAVYPISIPTLEKHWLKKEISNQREYAVGLTNKNKRHFCKFVQLKVGLELEYEFIRELN